MLILYSAGRHFIFDNFWWWRFKNDDSLLYAIVRFTYDPTINISLSFNGKMIQCLYVSWELSHTLTSFKFNIYLSNVQKRYHGKYSNSLCRPAEYRLDGKTPAEACGIELKGENKWIVLSQNASLSTKMN
jgi:hypothetical protein